MTKAVYTIVTTPPGASRRDKLWLRIGSGTVNPDGSINVLLDALPINGMLHIRDEAATEDLRVDDETGFATIADHRFVAEPGGDSCAYHAYRTGSGASIPVCGESRGKHKRR